jgi:hypothetical protein
VRKIKSSIACHSINIAEEKLAIASPFFLQHFKVIKNDRNKNASYNY